MSKPKYVTETIRLTPEKAKRIAARATQLGLTMEEFAVYAVIRYLDDRTPMPEELREQFSGSAILGDKVRERSERQAARARRDASHGPITGEMKCRCSARSL
jgi:hypothetical protein